MNTVGTFGGSKIILRCTVVNSAIISPYLLKLFCNRSDMLRLVITGTERVSRIAPDGYRVLNLYGSSETTPGVVWFEVDRKYENTPIGQAAGDIAVELIGEDGQPVSDGEEGEICVTGLLSTCYLNLPEKSAEVYEDLPDGRVRFHMGDMEGGTRMGICFM
jgi:non-ribosomal peptide synthetase component F